MLVSFLMQKIAFDAGVGFYAILLLHLSNYCIVGVVNVEDSLVCK